ncbi:citryl-CoA lyase [Amycolatopsis taiwanensis]|uniref:citrate synthase (unknown stereospecificity) n=1 Tax=Amycolatopsis taiwanensis TaxID=342230 RepID=A0A9W6VJ07_9PSEU|nr:citryl-CoA lyase [Amycolatopsis taiwanensis]GLY70235.1 citryl-CoA lyase [Amycolatopsis taiwanensis]
MSDARKQAIADTTVEATVDWWATAISDIEPGVIRMRGYPIEQLINGIGFTDMIWLMLRGELPSPGQSALLEKALVSAVDHGPQAPSIASARMAATCGIGLQGAVSTGVGLLGDVHGGAGQQAMVVYQGIRQAVADGEPLMEAVRRTVADYRAARRFLPGFGHRFHPRDPRRDPLLGAVAEQRDLGVVSGEYLRIATEIEKALETRSGRRVPMNIDGATAVIYAELGFEPELARGLFILSRSVGILAHAWEETAQARRIKGPLPPPLLAAYTGVSERDLDDSGERPE